MIVRTKRVKSMFAFFFPQMGSISIPAAALYCEVDLVASYMCEIGFVPLLNCEIDLVP